MRGSSISARRPLGQAPAIGVVVLLWLGYTALQTLSVTGHVSEPWSAILGFVPGIAGVAILTAAGQEREKLHLKVAPLSRGGLAVLAAVFVFALAVIVPFGKWQGLNWMAGLVYAPASGVSQELFFRAVLLPALLLPLRRRTSVALIIHSILFGLWHIGPFFLGAPFWAVVAVILVPSVSGIGWGWQVQRDRTVLWAMVQHSLIWVIAGQFPMPD